MNPLWLDNLNRLVLYNDGRLKNCECDTCEQFIVRIVAMCEQRGFYYLRKMGYLYHLTDTTKPLVKSMLHWITWTTENGVYVYRLNSIDCDCNRLVVAEVRGGSVSSIADFGYGFFASADACTGLCADNIAILVAQAITNSWTILGAGVLVQKTSAQYSCYRFDITPITASLAVDTGSSYKYIDCDCNIAEIASNYALWGYIEYPSCDCFDIRELILSYPDLFGVDDVSFGDDTVYTKDSTAGIRTNACLESQHSYDTWWCDYRNMYVIFKNSLVGMPDLVYHRYVDPLILVEFDANGRWLDGGGSALRYDYVEDGVIYFDGKMPPFTSQAEALVMWPHAASGMCWNGLTIRWVAENSQTSTETFWERSEAQAELDYYNSLQNKYGSNTFEAVYSSELTYWYHPQASATPPDLTITHVEGYIEYDSVNEDWVLHKPHDEFANGGIVYNLNFVQTNNGFLVNGGNGSFTDTLETYGFTDTIPYWTSPPTEAQLISQYSATYARCENGGSFVPCPQGTVKEIYFGTAVMEIPMYDMTYQVLPVKSIGGCQPKEWWDAIIGQYDEDEEESA